MVIEMDDEQDYLHVLRMKYAEDLERTLECMVCLEIPVDEVRMCTKGHHICSTCHQVLVTRGEKCPECNLSFSSARNYAVEKLSDIFTNIQSSILDPKHASNWRKMTSVGTQTDAIQNQSVALIRKSSRIKNSSREATSEKVGCIDKLTNGQKSISDDNDNCNLDVASLCDTAN